MKNRLNKKMYFALGLICLVFLVILLRAFKLQVIDYKEYKRIAENLSIQDIYRKPKRGMIYDRNMNLLASNEVVYSMWVRYEDVKDHVRTPEGRKKVATTIQKLNNIVKIDAKGFNKKIYSNKNFVMELGYNIPKNKIDEIKKLGIEWLGIYPETKRHYTFDVLASSVIGWVDSQGNGKGGIEYSMNRELSGVNGRIVSKTDRLGSELAFERVKKYEPKDGYDVVLTIDDVMQLYMEESLKKGVEKTGARRATAILMESKTGEIIAMGSYPSFNLNDDSVLVDEYKPEIAQLSEEEKKALVNERKMNYTTSWTYEPGSVGKLITVSAGIEEGLFGKDTVFNADKTFVEFNDGTRLYCWSKDYAHGSQTVEQAINNSCNVALMKMGNVIGKKTLYKYMRAFNLTYRLGIDLPREEFPLILDENEAHKIETFTMTYGHSYSVTPIQMITAVNAIANKGELVKPHIVKKVVDKNNNIIFSSEKEVVRRVISEKTAETVLEILKSTAEVGTAKVEDGFNGIDVGGKTGTSVQLVNGEYGDGVTVSYFLVTPSMDPKYSLLVIADIPTGKGSGSKSAGPIARDIIVDAYKYLGLKQEEVDESKMVEVPELIGNTPEGAVQIMEEAGLTYYLNNYKDDVSDQIVDEQFPKPGTKVQRGVKIILNIKVNEKEKEQVEEQDEEQDEEKE